MYIVFGLHFTTDWFQFTNEVAREIFQVLLFCALIANLVVDDVRCKNCKLMLYLGSISYGIYMYHMIVVILTLSITLKIQSIFNLSSLMVVLIVNMTCLIGTVLVSHFSYKYFESFFLASKYKFRN